MLDAVDLTFGGYLDLQLDKENRSVPRVVELCCAEVERRGIASVGIYRLSGNAATIQKIKTMFNQRMKKNISILGCYMLTIIIIEEEVRFDDEDMDINVVTGVMKRKVKV
jgi:hypothetical protein